MQGNPNYHKRQICNNKDLRKNIKNITEIFETQYIYTNFDFTKDYKTNNIALITILLK